VEFTKSNQIDLTVQPEVLEWFKARVWEQAHFQWHNIRRCKAHARQGCEGRRRRPVQATRS
jgi:hypothetical protein